MRIITVSREFGSGGRVLGRKIADILGYDYYDREIISTLARENGMDEQYLEQMLPGHQWSTLPLSMKKCFSPSASIRNSSVSLLVKEKEVIRNIAAKGRNCLIVGRNADWYLQDYDPLNIFVCASMESKIRRCMERQGETDRMSEKDMEKFIRSVDKNRRMAREVIAGNTWGCSSTYHLTLNTTGCDLDRLARSASDFIIAWFAE